jgi:hypothetical protein
MTIAAIFRQPSILRNLTCPLATRLIAPAGGMSVVLAAELHTPQRWRKIAAVNAPRSES